MTRVAVFAGGDLTTTQVKPDFDVFVGVDAGSLFVLEQGLPLDLAVGDFDSVSPQEWTYIRQAAKELVQSVPEKDDTDLEMALKVVFAHYPDASVTVFGAFGGRLDHMMSNFFLASEPDIAPFMSQLELVNDTNIVRYCPAGRHRVYPIEGMDYVSFMPSDGVRLSVSGGKYSLDESNYFVKKCYSSNEFLPNQPIEVTVDSGYVVVIYSKDKG